MGWLEDAWGGLTNTPQVQQAAGEDTDPASLVIRASASSITNKEAASILAGCELVIQRVISLSEPQYPLDPGAPDLMTKRNFLAKVRELEAAALSYDPSGEFPLKDSLRAYARQTNDLKVSTVANQEDRNKVVEQLGTDLKDNLENVTEGIGSTVKWMIVGAAVILGIVIVSKVK